MKKNTLIQKLKFLLNPKQKKQLFFLTILLIIGMLFEMAGLGVLIPALGLMLNTNGVNDYPIFQPFLNSLGNPSQKELVLYGMLFLILLYLIHFYQNSFYFLLNLYLKIIQNLFLCFYCST
jgi:hypothetical protein